MANNDQYNLNIHMYIDYTLQCKRETILYPSINTQ